MNRSLLLSCLELYDGAEVPKHSRKFLRWCTGVCEENMMMSVYIYIAPKYLKEVTILILTTWFESGTCRWFINMYTGLGCSKMLWIGIHDHEQLGIRWPGEGSVWSLHLVVEVQRKEYNQKWMGVGLGEQRVLGSWAWLSAATLTRWVRHGMNDDSKARSSGHGSSLYWGNWEGIERGSYDAPILQHCPGHNKGSKNIGKISEGINEWV